MSFLSWPSSYKENNQPSRPGFSVRNENIGCQVSYLPLPPLFVFPSCHKKRRNDGKCQSLISSRGHSAHISFHPSCLFPLVSTYFFFNKLTLYGQKKNDTNLYLTVRKFLVPSHPGSHGHQHSGKLCSSHPRDLCPTVSMCSEVT